MRWDVLNYFTPGKFLDRRIQDVQQRRGAVEKEIARVAELTGREPRQGQDPLIASYESMKKRLEDAKRGPLGLFGRKRRLGSNA